MTLSPEFLKSMQSLDDQALQGLQDRAEKSLEAMDAFTAKASELMGMDHVSGLIPVSEAGDKAKQESLAVNGIHAQGGDGPDAQKPA